MKNKKSVTYCIRLKSDIYADILSLALTCHTTMAHIVNYALADYLVDCRRKRILLKDLYENHQAD